MDPNKILSASLMHGIDFYELSRVFEENRRASSLVAMPQTNAAAQRAEMTDLHAAASYVVSAENLQLASDYILAFMCGDKRRIEKLYEEINAKPQQRQDNIRKLAGKYFKTFTTLAQVPALLITFGDDKSIHYPRMSERDKDNWHMLCQKRLSVLFPAVKHPNGLYTVRDGKNSISVPYEQLSKLWDVENTAYNFTSLKQDYNADRSEYDAGRKRFADVRYDSPPPDASAAPSVP